MDNFTHSLTGWAIGQAGLKNKSRKGLAALILGANAPDIDVFFGGMACLPLATHRGATHSLVSGIWVLPVLLAALLWAFDRWQVARGATFKSGLPMRPGWLLILSFIGVVSHPLLDLQTSYAVQLLSPFSNDWFHSESLFIIDVWLWTALSFAIWLSRRREKRGEARWMHPARAVLAVMAAYIAMNTGISVQAKQVAERAPALARPDVIFSSIEPAIFWRRKLVWREGEMIRRATYDPLRSPGRVFDVLPPVPTNMADPLARAGMAATPDIARFMRWSVMSMAVVKREGCTATVTYGDARFGDPRVAERFTHRVVLSTGAPGCPPLGSVMP